MDSCEAFIARRPPADLEHEQCLLAAILKGGSCPAFLGCQHFADSIHGMIYATAERFQEKRMAVSFTSLVAHFQRSGELAEVGGPTYLAQLLHGARPTLTPREYARAIHDLWVERVQLGRLMLPPGGAPMHEITKDIQL